MAEPAQALTVSYCFRVETFIELPQLISVFLLPSEFCDAFRAQMTLPVGETSLMIMHNRFDTIPQSNGRVEFLYQYGYNLDASAEFLPLHNPANRKIRLIFG